MEIGKILDYWGQFFQEKRGKILMRKWHVFLVVSSLVYFIEWIDNFIFCLFMVGSLLNEANFKFI